MDREIFDRMREVEQQHWWFVARRAIIADQIARLGLPTDAEILEVGCGTGGNLQMLSRFGQVRAVEPDEESRAYAGRNGIAVQAGRLPDGLPSYEAKFDLIASFDVIEHVEQDAASVAALADLLKPGGVLVATVPANAWMWSRHDEMHHHRRRYRLADFQALFVQAGLAVEKATYFNTLLFPVIGAVRLAKRLAGAKGGDDDAMPSALTNGALKRLFASESGLIERFDLPFGVSILIIARRPA